MEKENKTIADYTDAYVAKKANVQLAMTWLNLIKAHLEHFGPEDAGKLGVHAYILDYKGGIGRRALQGIVYCKVDIGIVGDRFMDVWPREVMLRIGEPSEMKGPIRVAYLGDRVYKVI